MAEKHCREKDRKFGCNGHPPGVYTRTLSKPNIWACTICGRFGWYAWLTHGAPHIKMYFLHNTCRLKTWLTSSHSSTRFLSHALSRDADSPLPAVISWQAFRMSVGPPALLQPTFLLSLFFWSTAHGLTTNKHRQQLKNMLHMLYKLHCVVAFLPFPHMCCRAVQGERWNTLFPDWGTVTSCSVSRRWRGPEDTGQLCSTPTPRASSDPLWCNCTGREGTAGPENWETVIMK